MRPRRRQALVVFTDIRVRAYQENDISRVTEICKSAIEQTRYSELKDTQSKEYAKCKLCGIVYSFDELLRKERWPAERLRCKKCSKPYNLTYCWELLSFGDVAKNLELILSQRKPIALVAEQIKGKERKIAGFALGSNIQLEKFPFLEGVVSPEANYMEYISVILGLTRNGIGTLLGKEYLAEAERNKTKDIIVRAYEQDEASMALFKKLGFKPLKDINNLTVYDAKESSKLFLMQQIYKSKEVIL